MTDRLDLQLLDFVAVAVALDASQPGVDDKADAGHRQRRLGHVGGKHDARRAAGLEDPVLLGLRQAGIQRQNLARAAPRVMRKVLAQVVGGFADLSLAGQEDEDVATAATTPQLVDGVGYGDVQVAFSSFLERPPALLHWKQAA